MTPAEVRRGLAQALQLDLVGPENGSELEAEVLTQAPSRWYLTGFLVPLEADETQRADETGEDDFALTSGEGEANDDAAPAEPPAARFFHLQSASASWSQKPPRTFASSSTG